MAARNPERPGLTKVGMNRCEKLRWKGLFIDAEWDPTIQHSNDRSFWCQHTWNCLGPDGKIAKVWVKVNPPESASEVLTVLPDKGTSLKSGQ